MFTVEQIFREANVSTNSMVKYEDFVKIACAPVPDYYWMECFSLLFSIFIFSLSFSFLKEQWLNKSIFFKSAMKEMYVFKFKICKEIFAHG